MYTQKTHNIEISVRPMFLEDQSDPSDSQYVWAYWVRIDNQSSAVVQLKRRYWNITDAVGHVQEVRGDGVVGEQPRLLPGQTFEYVSGTPLATPSGLMFGHYEMETEGGEVLTVNIPVFSLDSPYQSARLN